MQNADPLNPELSEELKVGGVYSQKQMKRFTRAMRKSFLGPTTVYYAGVSAPAIAAGVATVCGASFERAGWSSYWVVMISSLIAAMSGICWYLVFMRLSFRNSVSRSAEIEARTDVVIKPDHIVCVRGDVSTSIGKNAIIGVSKKKDFLYIQVSGSNDISLPKDWFSSNTVYDQAHSALMKLV